MPSMPQGLAWTIKPERKKHEWHNSVRVLSGEDGGGKSSIPIYMPACSFRSGAHSTVILLFLAPAGSGLPPKTRTVTYAAVESRFCQVVPPRTTCRDNGRTRTTGPAQMPHGGEEYVGHCVGIVFCLHQSLAFRPITSMHQSIKARTAGER